MLEHADPRMTTYAGLLCVLAVCAYWVMGRRRWLRLLAAVLFTLGIVRWGLLPVLCQGVPAVPACLATGVLVTVCTVPLVTRLRGGLVRVGPAVVAGLLLTLGLAYYAARALRFTGYDAVGAGGWLLKSGFACREPDALTMIVAGGLFLGAIGAIIDLTVSVMAGTSAARMAGRRTSAERVQSALKIGRDIGSVSVVTVLLALIGERRRELVKSPH